jgi:hypothetical protein
VGGVGAPQDGGLEPLQSGCVEAAGQQPGDLHAAGLGGLVDPVAAVQGQRQQAPQALVVGLLGGEQLQLGHQLGVAAEVQVGLDACLPCGQVQALQPGDLVLGEREAGHVVGDGAAPQPQGGVQPLGGGRRVAGGQCLAPLLDQPLEADGVEPVGLDAQQVAGLGGLQRCRRLAPGSPGPQGQAEMVDVAVEGRPGRGPAGAAQDGLELGRRHAAVGLQQQLGEQRAELGAELDALAVDLHHQRPENPEVHGAPPGAFDGLSTWFPRSTDSLTDAAS